MKRNLKQDFEMVYMRANCVKRYVPYATPENLNSVDYKRITQYMAKRFWNHNSGVYAASGFYYEDILNVTRLFAALYYGNINKNSQPFKANFMMNYIQQRLVRLTEWCVRKFSLEEVVYTTEINPKVIDQAAFEQIALVEDGITDEWLRKNDSQYTGEVEIAVDDDDRPSARENKELLRKLRDKLNSDPGKYADVLSYYATTKHVGVDTRKAARKLCRQNKINWKIWLKDHLSRKPEEQMEFCS